MRMRYDFHTMDDGGADSTSWYMLRRHPSGVWEAQLSYDCWLAELHHLHGNVQRRGLLWEHDAERLQHLQMQRGPQWERLPDDLGPSLEAAYQRFIHQRAW
jgi:hypothetical protein